MKSNGPTVTVHMVSSLDGFIARPDRSLSWLETPDTYEKGVEGDNVEEFLKSIDCYVMGFRTYEQAMELSREFGWPYGETPTFVLTHRGIPTTRGSVQFCSGDLRKLVNDQLAPRYRNIWVVGGAALVRDFFREGLVDEIRHAIIPIILGEGTPFYDHIGRELPLHLKDVTAYKSGMVELWYEVKKN